MGVDTGAVLAVVHKGAHSLGFYEYASGELLEALIERERDRGIEPGRIVTAGFSQGGAIAVHTALRYPERLAGLMALSTYLPLQSAFRTEVIDQGPAANQDLPIFVAHGSFDPVLPLQLGRLAADFLVDAGFSVEWHEYPMAHAVCPQEIADIRRWLLSVYQAATV